MSYYEPRSWSFLFYATLKIGVLVLFLIGGTAAGFIVAELLYPNGKARWVATATEQPHTISPKTLELKVIELEARVAVLEGQKP